MSGIVTAVCIAFLTGGLQHGVRGEDDQPQEQSSEQQLQEQRGCAFRGRNYAVGERWATGPPDKCAKYLCEGDDQIAALTCPWFIPAPGCSVSPGDEAAVYPGCCPLRKCHDAPALDAGKGPGKATDHAGGDAAATAAPLATGTARILAIKATTETLPQTATEMVTETATVVTQSSTDHPVTETSTVTVTAGSLLQLVPVTSTMVQPS